MISARSAKRIRLWVTCTALAGACALAARPLHAADADGVRRVLTLLDVVAEEYREGIADGQIVRPVEYDEAKLFLSEAQDRLGRAGIESTPFAPQFEAAHKLIEDKAPAETVRSAMEGLRDALQAATGVRSDVFPAQPPSASQGRTLFAESCVSCHGSGANGKGERAAELNPSPANFTDPQFMRAETPYDFFQIITVGKPSSAMPAWGDVLSIQERWDLVSYLWNVRHGAASLAEGQGVYLNQCASCHGPRGDGKGVFSSFLSKPTRDLTSIEALARSSDTDLFASVTKGVPGTPMPTFARSLSPDERWGAVAYLRMLALGGDDGSGVSNSSSSGGLRRFAGLLRMLSDEYGKAVPTNGPVDELEYRESAILLDQLERNAEAALARLRNQGDAARLVEAVDGIKRTVLQRGPSPTVDALATSAAELIAPHLSQTEPQQAATAPDALAETERLLDLGLAAYGRNDPQARDLVSDAYFEFEPLEKKLAVTAPDLTRQVETRFLDLRGVLSKPGAQEDAARVTDALKRDLAAVRSALQPETNSYALFLQSATIILREGFEVVLIIGALITFVVKSGNAQMKRPILAGTGVGIVMSLLTAYVLAQVLRGTTTGAGEILEGTTMLLASVVLFFVSYWLISKAEADKWQRYIQGKVKTAVVTGSGLALAGTAFLAVYREGVETVLFYEALLGSAASDTAVVVAGFGVGCAALACVYWLFARFGMRIPIRQFFLATSFLLYYLAVVFAGKGVAELQEAGWIAITPLSGWPRIDFLGIYPTVETMLAQGLFIGLMVYAAIVTWRRRAVREGAVPPLLEEARMLRELLTEVRGELQRLSGRAAPGAETGARLEQILTRTSELEEQLRLRFPGNGGSKAAKH